MSLGARETLAYSGWICQSCLRNSPASIHSYRAVNPRWRLFHAATAKQRMSNAPSHADAFADGSDPQANGQRLFQGRRPPDSQNRQLFSHKTDRQEVKGRRSQGEFPFRARRHEAVDGKNWLRKQYAPGDPSKGAKDVAKRKTSIRKVGDASIEGEVAIEQQQGSTRNVRIARNSDTQRPIRLRKYFDRETPDEQRKLDGVKEAQSLYSRALQDPRQNRVGKNYRLNLPLNPSQSSENEREHYTMSSDENTNQRSSSSPSQDAYDIDLSLQRERVDELESSATAKVDELESSPYQRHRLGSVSRTRDDQHLPFEGASESNFEPKDPIDRSRPARESTITDPERKIFSKLFDSLTKLPTRKASDGDKPSTMARKANEDVSDFRDEDEDSDIDIRTSQLDLENEEGDEIDLTEHYYQDLDSDQAPPADSEDPDFLGRYPSELRSMAANAQVTLAKQIQVQRKATEKRLEAKGQSYDPAVAQQRAELRRIENALNHAPTDVAIWEILENDVFPKLTILDSDQRKDVHAKETAAKPQTIPKELRDRVKSIQHIASKDFQTIFMLAVQLLCRRTSYTPLAIKLLARIKSHSLTSYVLGTNGRLYNEIIAYHWRMHTDIAAMVSYLREMHIAGLPMSSYTLAVIDDATLYRHRALRGDFGLALQAIEGMIGRSRDAEDLQKWKRRLRRSIEETIVEKARRAEGERRMRDEGAFADSEEGTNDFQTQSKVAAAA